MSGHADDGSDVGWMRGNHPHHNHNHHHPTHDTTGSESSSMNPSSLSSDSDLPIQPAATNAPLPASYQHRYELSHTEVTYPASPPEDLQHPKRLTYEEDLAALVDMISADGSVGSEVQVGVEGLPVRSVASSETGTGSPEARSPEMVPSVRQSVVHAPQLIGAGVMVGVGLSMASQPVEASHAARHRPPTAQRTVSPVPPMRVSPTPRRGEGGRGDGGSACDTPSSVGLSQISPINMSGLSGTSRNRTRVCGGVLGRGEGCNVWCSRNDSLLLYTVAHAVATKGQLRASCLVRVVFDVVHHACGGHLGKVCIVLLFSHPLACCCHSGVAWFGEWL